MVISSTTAALSGTDFLPKEYDMPVERPSVKLLVFLPLPAVFQTRARAIVRSFLAILLVTAALPSSTASAQSGWSKQKVVEYLKQQVQVPSDFDWQMAANILDRCTQEVDAFYAVSSERTGHQMQRFEVYPAGWLLVLTQRGFPISALAGMERNAVQNAQGVAQGNFMSKNLSAEGKMRVCMYRARSGMTWAEGGLASPSPTVRPAPSGNTPSQMAAAASPAPLQAAEATKQEALSAVEDALNAPNEPASDLEAGEDASQCLKLRWGTGPGEGAKLVNSCAYRIEGIWCVAGFDCKPTYSNMHTFEPGSSWPAFGTSGDGSGRTVNYAACRGRNSIRVAAEPLMHQCDKVANP